MYGEDLNQYIKSNPNPREIKRAITVKMWLEGYTHGQIQNILGVSSGFISKWTDQYEVSGIEALKFIILVVFVSTIKVILRSLASQNI